MPPILGDCLFASHHGSEQCSRRPHPLLGTLRHLGYLPTRIWATISYRSLEPLLPKYFPLVNIQITNAYEFTDSAKMKKNISNWNIYTSDNTDTMSVISKRWRGHGSIDKKGFGHALINSEAGEEVWGRSSIYSWIIPFFCMFGMCQNKKLKIGVTPRLKGNY